MYSREETAREEEERRVDAAAPAEPTDPDGDFEWRDDEAAPLRPRASLVRPRSRGRRFRVARR